MKNPGTNSGTSRREAMKMIATGSVAGILGLYRSPLLQVVPQEKKETTAYAKGMPAVKIRKVRAIATAPAGSNLIVVKVETTEPGLYGLGCATFTQRAEAVITAINSYLDEF
jgi:mannonate dehydratase